MENELKDGWYWIKASNINVWHLGQLDYGRWFIAGFGATPTEVGPRIPSPEELLAQSAELVRIKKEAACPCCRAGTNIEAQPCQECKCTGLAIVAYETCRIHYKLQGEALAASEERERGLRGYVCHKMDCATICVRRVGDPEIECNCGLAALLAPAPTSGEGQVAIESSIDAVAYFKSPNHCQRCGSKPGPGSGYGGYWNHAENSGSWSYSFECGSSVSRKSVKGVPAWPEKWTLECKEPAAPSVTPEGGKP